MASLFTECVGKQAACVCAPREIRVVEPLQVVGRVEQSLTPLGSVEIAGKFEHGRVIERRIAVEISAGGEHEQRTSHGGVSFFLGQRDVPSCDVRGDDEVDVSRSGTPLRSSRA
jgi:hypothetical protein